MFADAAFGSIAFQATTEKPKALIEVLKTVHAESCPETYNFHMHTCYSDGRLQPQDLMSQALEIGLQGLAITDHHTVDGYLLAHQWLEDWHWQHPATCHPPVRSSQPAIQLWTGVEITSSLLDNEVHILGYGFNPQHEGLQSYLRGNAPKGEAALAANVIKAIQSAGGLAVLAHPARYRLGPDVLIPAAADCGVDGVETYYAYDNPEPWRPTPEKTAEVRILAERYHLLSSCGTDTHGITLTRRL